MLYGEGGTFCSGADLKAMDQRLEPDGPGPMGPTRMRLSVLEAEGRDSADAMRTELRFGHDSLATGTAAVGAARFAGGAGRGGAPD